MSRTASPIPLRPTDYNVNPPPLHPGQLMVANDPSRFKVVVCGRQWGKTMLGAVMCVQEAARGGDVWWVAPSFPIGELGWRVVDHLCRQIPDVKFEGRPNNRITLPTGGTIQMKSADNPDSLRGATLDGVVFDEASQAKPEAWPTLRPTLSVRGGWAMFISTPYGLNWFHDVFEDATRDGWERWRFPSTDNPWLDPSDVEEARGTMSSLMFSQEYEAEFVSYGSGMFQQEWLQHYRTSFLDDGSRVFMLGDEPVPAAGCQVFHTVDLAWSMAEDADFTVISTWAITPKRHLLLLDVQRGHFEGPDIVPKLRFAYEKWGGTHIGVEKATRQMGIIQEADRTGLPVKELKADKDKIARALPATARMERKTIWFPRENWAHELEDELFAFPVGRHDDFVDTLSYACLELMNQSVYEQRGIRTI